MPSQSSMYSFHVGNTVHININTLTTAIFDDNLNDVCNLSFCSVT